MAQVMNRLSKARSIQASMTNLLRRRYLEVKKDPYMAQLIKQSTYDKSNDWSTC